MFSVCGVLWTWCFWMLICFHKFGSFSVTVSLNKLFCPCLFLCSFWDPHNSVSHKSCRLSLPFPFLFFFLSFLFVFFLFLWLDCFRWSNCSLLILSGTLLYYFCGVTDPWFLVFLQVLHFSLYIWRGNSCPSLTDWLWERKIITHQPDLKFGGSLRPFLWMHPLHSFFSFLVGGGLRIVCFLSIPDIQV